MTFQIKSFVSIVAGMINHVRGVQSDLTDFHVGSVNRVMLEAPSIEIDELYQQMFNGLKDAIPVATYNSFNFALLPAAAASGLVRVTIASTTGPTTIVAGTLFSSADSTTAYASVEDVVITAGNTTGDVLVAAVVAGVQGNIAAGVDFDASPSPGGFVSATNLYAFSNGAELETEDQRKRRFVSYVTTLQRGTVSAIQYGARTAAIYDAFGVEIERVKAVSVVEPWILDDEEPPALINVFVHNGSGSTSTDLVDQARNVIFGYVDGDGNKIPGWKAAGVKAVVAAATEVPLDVAATLVGLPGYDEDELCDLAEAELNQYVLGLDIAESYQEAEAVHRVKSIAGVFNITALPADTAVDGSEKLMPGTIAVTTA